MNKIIRTICYFSDNPSEQTISSLDQIAELSTKNGFVVQTKRLCSSNRELVFNLDENHGKEGYLFGLGSTILEDYKQLSAKIIKANNVSLNLELANKEITEQEVGILFNIISQRPSLTFNFTYVFNNEPSSPYFPSGNYQQNGFSIGLQPTDLSENCSSLSEWFSNIKGAWNDIINLVGKNPEFLGIDSSIAPLFTGISSFVNFIKRLGLDFSYSATTDTYLQITKFIKQENPKPVGLCGIMFPCLEDFELADEYEKGNFSIERNVYLSLHSGLGIDTYPMGIDEKPERIIDILKLIQGLSNKYHKPLAARFVSDGKAKIGEKTDFQNQYLKDVVVKPL